MCSLTRAPYPLPLSAETKPRVKHRTRTALELIFASRSRATGHATEETAGSRARDINGSAAAPGASGEHFGTAAIRAVKRRWAGGANQRNGLPPPPVISEQIEHGANSRFLLFRCDGMEPRGGGWGVILGTRRRKVCDIER